MQNDFGPRGVVLVGVTTAPQAEARAFREEFQLEYAVLADAQGALDTWGVKRLWGSVVYLIGPDDMVLVRGIDECRAELETRLSRN